MNKFRLTLALAVVFSLRVALAATVTADLSADETTVGMPVQLQIRVDGTTNVIMPPGLDVSGLDARMAGRSNSVQVQVINGRMTTSSFYAYTIVPMREGTFEIPSVEITVDGKRERTPAKKLVVRAGSAGGSPQPPPMAGGLPPTSATRSSSSDAEGRMYYAELLVPRKSIYVGEIVPVEVRFYFNERGSFRLAGPAPDVSGEGFTVEKLSPPQQTQEAAGDDSYQVLSFKTAITAVKSGELPLPRASLVAVARVPQGVNDLFSQLLGGQGFSEEKEIKIESKPGSIRVKALPVEGRPEGFSGAVGEFTLAASVDSPKAAAGDPVTLKVAISGRGNFSGMGEPKLIDADGWRVYPPTDKFAKTDAIGLTGTKTFEMPMVAQEPQHQTPVAEFSYFDPVREKYASIRSQPIPVEAAATPVAAVASATEKSSPTPGPAAAAEGPGQWLARETPRSWVPLARRPMFWIGNGAAAVAFLALLGGVIVRRRNRGPAAARAAQVRQRNQLLGEVARGGVADGTIFSKARNVLAAQAALSGQTGPFEYVQSLEAAGRDVTELRGILSRADELEFSGGGANARVDAEERRRVVAALREVCR